MGWYHHLSCPCDKPIKLKSSTFLLFYIWQRAWLNLTKQKSVPSSSENILSVIVYFFNVVKAGPHAHLDSFSVGFAGGLVTNSRVSNGHPVVSLPFIHTRTQTAMTKMLARKLCGSAVGMVSYWLDCTEELESNCLASKSSGVARCLKVSWYIFTNLFLCNSQASKGVLE